jgi:hypothetical protein
MRHEVGAWQDSVGSVHDRERHRPASAGSAHVFRHAGVLGSVQGARRLGTQAASSLWLELLWQRRNRREPERGDLRGRKPVLLFAFLLQRGADSIGYRQGSLQVMVSALSLVVRAFGLRGAPPSRQARRLASVNVGVKRAQIRPPSEVR